VNEPFAADEPQMPVTQVLAQPGMVAVRAEAGPSGRIIAVTERHAALHQVEEDQYAIVPWHELALPGVAPSPAALPQAVLTRDRQDKLAEALRHLLTIEAPTDSDRDAIRRFWHELLALSPEPRHAGGEDHAPHDDAR